MGVISKKTSGGNDKKKNKVKDNIKNKFESNTKFPKVKNQGKPTGTIKDGEKFLEPKKKFEKKHKKGSPPTGSPKPKQSGNNQSPNQKKKKNKNALKQKPDKPGKVEVADAITDTPVTTEETKVAVKAAKVVKIDSDRINKLLTKILQTSDIIKEEKQSKPKVIVDQLQVEDLIPRDKLNSHVKSFMKIVKHTKSQPGYKTSLISDKRLITLSILAMKIPDCPTKFAKLKLPFALYTPESDICLFVSDLERGRKRDQEPFVRHYEEILEKNGVTCVNKIITISHLIKEYSTFELKFRLANTYDIFLVEGKVSNRVGKFLGKIFAKIKRNPIVIRDFSNESINSALNMVTYRQSGLGPVNIIHFAYDTMTESHIAANLYSLIHQLKKIYPGGWTNIKSLSLTAFNELAYPIMYNYALPNDIPVPKLESIQDVKIQKEKALLDGALQKVEITENGVVVKKKLKRKFDENDLSNSENEEQGKPVHNSPSKHKKKNKVVDEEPVKQEPEPVAVVTFKKDKKKKKTKELVKEEQESIVETPEPVEIVEKQKKNKKNKTADFNGTNSSVVPNKKPAQNAKFEKPTDGVKPKKKKLNKAT